MRLRRRISSTVLPVGALAALTTCRDARALIRRYLRGTLGVSVGRHETKTHENQGELVRAMRNLTQLRQPTHPRTRARRPAAGSRVAVGDAQRSAPNPFVGPRALRAGEALYGRDRVLAELTDLLIAERIVLLYSPSRAGKTSLLAAGVVPQLEREGFRVLPTVRVGRTPALAAAGPPANRYVLTTLLSLEEGLSGDARHRRDELGTLSLRDYLRPVLEVDEDAAGEDPPKVVLVFDQFEEILTLDPTDQAAKAAFFGQLGAALRHRRVWALFAMREAYVAGLDPYLHLVPTRCRTRYRLDFLGLDAARQAIQHPAAAAGRTVSDEAARRLVDDLRRVRVQRPDGVVEKLGPHVEPMQLQVVCRRLFQHLPPDATDLDVGDLDRVRDLHDAVAEYGAETVTEIAAETRVGERGSATCPRGS